MIKTIIVDDESDVLFNLKYMIPWEEFGFDICYSARNGKEAMELMDRHSPKLMITDISMPGMDGLTLARGVLARHPDTIIIFMTGHNEFDYVKQALNLGAIYYILKPIDKEELIEALEKVKETNEKTKEVHRLRQKADLGEELIRRRFLYNLVTGQIGIHEERVRDFFRDSMGGKKLEGKMRVIIFEVDGFSKLRKDEETMKHRCDKIIEVIKGVMGERSDSIPFVGEDFRVYLIIGGSNEIGGLEKGVLIQYEKIRLLLEAEYGFTITIGCGGDHLGYGNIRTSYYEAMSALRYKLILGGNRVISYGSIETYNIHYQAFSAEHRRDFIIGLRSGNFPRIQRILDVVFEDIKKKRIGMDLIEIVYTEIATLCCSYGLEMETDSKDTQIDLINQIDAIREGESLGELKKSLLDLIKECIDSIKQDKSGARYSLIDRAIAYIDENYGDNRLSVEMIAREVYANKDYLSSLFRKEFDMPLVQYLNNYRLEKAKEYLDKGVENISWIAEKVGYKDPFYFSRRFKKHFGISPTTYLTSRQP